MLANLNIRNIALMDNISVDFGAGLNVITGETGAGKSILVDSLNLLFGARGDKELVRAGEKKGYVEGVFDVPESRLAALENLGIDCQDGAMILTREISSDGKSLCRINGRAVTLSVLKEVSSWLVDIHGQHEHQALLKSENHIGFLDNYAGEEVETAKNDAAQAYLKYKGIQNKLQADWGTDEQRARKADLLRYQIEEISMAELEPGELDALIAERNRLINIEQIMQGLDEAYQAVHSEGGALDCIRGAIASLGGLEKYSEEFSGLAQRIDSAYYELEDISTELSDQIESVDNDPRRLAQIEKRIELISDILRKYGASEQKALEYMQSASVELEEILNSDDIIAQLKNDLKSAESELSDLCGNLTSIRKKYAKKLAGEISSELADLGMDKAVFEVNISSKRPSADGTDVLEFMFSANPGQPVRPLAKIISGGELSRLMLAIKNILAERDMIPTMVFDEIDTGISGKMAKVTAEKMAGIASSHQVLCVTHLSVIAAMADNHYFIEKTFSDNSTVTMVTQLDDNGRIEELARLTGSGATNLAREHAREMLDSCREYKRTLSR